MPKVSNHSLSAAEILVENGHTIFTPDKIWSPDVSKCIPGRFLKHSRKLRVVLYSHDTMGLGHFRRNLLIAQSLISSNLNPNILMVAGARETGSFTTPPGVDCLTLPSLYKDYEGKYSPRLINIPLSDLMNLRTKVLYSSIVSFEPDVLIVDTVPKGVFGELIPTLEALHSTGKTVCILGHRDIRDEPEVVRKEWLEEKNEEVLRKYYDQMWIYGDVHVYDFAREYGFPVDIADMVRYTGYLDPRARLALATSKNGGTPLKRMGIPERFVLCMLGGGQDGDLLASAFVRAELPEGMGGVLITGPFMKEEVKTKLMRYSVENPNLHILDFIPEPTVLFERASSIIAMGGYNTVSEILGFGKRALIVPRTVPRKEQFIRATRLKEIGLIDMLSEDHLSPEMISTWLKDNCHNGTRNFSSNIDMQGLERIPRLLETIMQYTFGAVDVRGANAGF